VDRRLLALFWHLAERWGRVVSDGVLVPLTLSHRLLGQLVGARRPTVSTALADLAREDQIQRRPDGTWLLKGEPVGVPAPVAAEVVRQRRRLLPPIPVEPDVVDPVPDVPPIPVDASPPERVAATMGAELSGTLGRLLELSQSRGAQLRALCEESVRLRDRSIVLRDERQRRREAMSPGRAPLST
jgi:hypothetical protein